MSLRFLLYLVALIGAFLLASRHLQSGSGDRRGARRLAVFVLVLGLLDWVVGQRHSTLLSEEAYSLYLGVASSTLSAVAVWVWYLAMEPYVRRWWPQTLITWSRLLQGRFRDPLLGRDILVGGMFGLGLVLVMQFDTLLPAWLGLPEPAPRLPAGGWDLAELLGIRYKLGTVISVLLTSITFGLTVLVLMLLLRVVIRIPWLASATFCVLLTGAFCFETSYDMFLPWVTNGVLTLAVVVVLTRVGLVAVILGKCVSTFVMTEPITSDLTAWYAPASNFTVVIVAGLLVYGAYVSLAGRPTSGASHVGSVGGTPDHRGIG